MKHQTFTFTIIFSFIFSCSAFAQWESLGDDIIPRDHRVWSIKIASDQSVWATTTFDFFPPTNRIPQVYRSADEGNTWTNSEIPAAISTYGWDIHPIDSLNAFIALDRAGLFQTIDGGQTWAKVGTYPFRAYYLHFFNLNEGWVVGADTTASERLVMSLTADGGQTWTNSGPGVGYPAGTSFPTNPTGYLPNLFSTNSAYDVYENTILLGFSAGNYWRSDDKGYNWTQHETPLNGLGRITTNITMKDENTFMVASDFLAPNQTGTPTKTFTTTDGGLTWNIEGDPGITAASIQYIPNTDSIFIIVGHNNFGWGSEGTAISYDYGQNWEMIDATSLIAIDFIDEFTGYGGCCNNIWATANGQIHKWNFDFTTSTFEVVKSDLVIVMPNPVSTNMTISLNNEFQSDELVIEIISATGQICSSTQVQTNEQITIQTTDLPKGFYSLRVSGNQKSVIKKFIKG